MADVPHRLPPQRCRGLDPDPHPDAGECPLHPGRARRHGAGVLPLRRGRARVAGRQGYFPPLHLIGPRAKHGTLDLPCSYTADQQSVELVWVGDEQVPDGFEQVRPRVHARVVPVAECEVFDIALMARWGEHRVRVLQQAGDEALVVLTPDSATQVGSSVPSRWSPASTRPPCRPPTSPTARASAPTRCRRRAERTVDVSSSWSNDDGVRWVTRGAAALPLTRRVSRAAVCVTVVAIASTSPASLRNVTSWPARSPETSHNASNDSDLGMVGGGGGRDGPAQSCWPRAVRGARGRHPCGRVGRLGRGAPRRARRSDGVPHPPRPGHHPCRCAMDQVRKALLERYSACTWSCGGRTRRSDSVGWSATRPRSTAAPRWWPGGSASRATSTTVPWKVPVAELTVVDVREREIDV